MKKISIITVVFNAPDLLEKTIKSLSIQNHIFYEYIVIDGSSEDRTVKIIKKYENFISDWISEPDNGIYDAMNKGLHLATGDYIWFINAGDEIYNSETIKKLLSQMPDADVYYGDTMIIDNHGHEIGLRRLKPNKPLTWKSFQMGQLVSHQAFIAKRELCPNYDLKYKHSADTDWQIKILKKSIAIVNTNQILCRFLDGGKSKQNIIPSLIERFDIMIKNYGLFKTILNHVIISIKFFLFFFRNRRF